MDLCAHDGQQQRPGQVVGVRRSFPGAGSTWRAGYLRVPLGACLLAHPGRLGRVRGFPCAAGLDWETGTNLVGRRHLEAGPVGQRMSRAGSSHLRAGLAGRPPRASGKLGAVANGCWHRDESMFHDRGLLCHANRRKWQQEILGSVSSSLRRVAVGCFGWRGEERAGGSSPPILTPNPKALGNPERRCCSHYLLRTDVLTPSHINQPSRSGCCLDIHPLQMPHRLTCKAREDCLHIVASSLLPT